MKLSGSTGAYITKWKSEVTGRRCADRHHGEHHDGEPAEPSSRPARVRRRRHQESDHRLEHRRHARSRPLPRRRSPTTNWAPCKRSTRMRDAAADAAGNVYVANYESNNILEFTWSGSAWTCATASGPRERRAATRRSAAATATAHSRIPTASRSAPIPSSMPATAARRSTSPTPTTTASRSSRRTGTFVAEYRRPRAATRSRARLRSFAGLPSTATGNVWGADLWGNRLDEFTRSPAAYTYSQTAARTRSFRPGARAHRCSTRCAACAFDASGDVVAMDTVNQRVAVFDPTGTSDQLLRAARLHRAPVTSTGRAASPSIRPPATTGSPTPSRATSRSCQPIALAADVGLRPGGRT